MFVNPLSQTLFQFELGKLKVKISTILVFCIPDFFVSDIILLSVAQFNYLVSLQNIMPISAAMFRSESKNPVPQCPPRLDVQMLAPVVWSRMPNDFLSVESSKVSERHGWMVECNDPLMMMALHIPEENR